MSQISPPMRIVLAVAVVFAAVYMVVLRPKDEVAPAPATPVPAAEAGGPEANSSLGKAVESARETAGAAESAAAARAGESESESSAPSTTQSSPSASQEQTAPAKPAEPADPALADLPKWLQESMDKKVVAILFTNDQSADDKRTADALRASYDGNGDVVHRAVPIAEISKYEAVAQGVDVQQSPTLMVIARDRSAEALVGYSDRDAINQAIVDALLATDNPRKTVEWLQVAQDECRQITNRAIIGVSPGDNPSGVRQNVAATMATMTSSLATLRNAPIPAAYKPVKDVLTRYIASEIAVGRQVQGMIAGNNVNVIAVNKAVASNDALQSRAVLEMNAHGVSSCN